MARGPKRGSTRIGGRKKGTPNKVTADVRAAASHHGEAAINKLVHLMNHAESEQVQVLACKEILDRAYGKASQAITGEYGVGPMKLQIQWLDTNNSTNRCLPSTSHPSLRLEEMH